MTASTPDRRSVDVAVIGAGTAGLNAWRAASREGASALMIDPGPLGTTCARVGCMPSKLLIAAAEAAHTVERAELFGVRVGDVSIDRVAVMERLRKMRDLFVSKTIARGPEVARERGELIDARARFVGPNTLAVGDDLIDAKAVVLATGSSPWLPPAWRGLGERVLTTDDVFELPELPDSLLVIGAGAIGLELGQAFSRLGVRVAILDVVGRLAGLDDPEVHDSAAALFRAELDIHLRHELIEATPGDDGIFVRFTGDDGAEHAATWDHVLVAAGRRPNLDGLDLAAAGLDPLPPFDPATGRFGDSHLFGAGDVTGSRMLLHEAGHEGRISGANAARLGDVHRIERKTPLALVFTDPQVALVGLRASELDPERHAVGALDFRFNGRAKALGRDAGRLHVYGEVESGLLVGGTLVGPDVEHLGHLLAWAIQAGLTVEQATSMPFYHPVLEEGLESALKDLGQQIRTRRT
jgi:dihydrolipoamide dehydrogenase